MRKLVLIAFLVASTMGCKCEVNSTSTAHVGSYAYEVVDQTGKVIHMLEGPYEWAYADNGYLRLDKGDFYDFYCIPSGCLVRAVKIGNVER